MIYKPNPENLRGKLTTKRINDGLLLKATATVLEIEIIDLGAGLDKVF